MTGAADDPRIDIEELYEDAPCGYLATDPDGRITMVNRTLLRWLGHDREDLVGRKRFPDLLTGGGKLYHETHYAPLLRMQGEVREIALDLVSAKGERLPVLVNSVLKTEEDGTPRMIRTTVFDASDRRAYERELLRARQEADRERERLQRLATTLQRTLLPPVLPAVPGLEVAGYYHPASTNEIGGDFYDLFPLDGTRWGFFLGDVCGKGPEAAVTTSLARYTLRAAAVNHSEDPAEVLSVLNTILLQEYQGEVGRFCTVVFGVLTPTPDGFAVHLAGGGHLPPLAVKRCGAVEEVDIAGGQLVGVLPSPRFKTTSALLLPGDTLLLYTDGLPESRTPSGAFLGDDDRLVRLVEEKAGAGAKAIVDSLAALLAGFGDSLFDDTAILAFTNQPR